MTKTDTAKTKETQRKPRLSNVSKISYGVVLTVFTVAESVGVPRPATKKL